MSSTFVLAPVPAAARRRPAPSPSSRSRSGSNASCSTGRTRTRSRSRRPSLHHTRYSPTTPSASFINFVDTPCDTKYIATESQLLKSPATPSCEHVNAQLLALGYQAGFLRSANQSPRPIFRRIFSKSQPTTPHDKGFPPVPPVPKIPVSVSSTPIAKKPKQYSKTNVRPTMYAQDVQVDIFFNGGKEKDHISRAATRANGTSANKALAAGTREVGGYKDEKGMLWWDEDEQWEWAALLPKEDDSDSNSHEENAWVDFEGEFERRSSTSSAYSDVSVDALLDELEELVSTMGAGAGVGADCRLEALPPRCVLAMPRPRGRGAKGQGSAYLFPVELTHNNTNNTKPVSSPSTASFGACRAKGAARRRRAGPPPPLTLAPPSPYGARLGGGVVLGVVGPIASARHFKHAHSHSFDDSFVTREAEFAWASLVSERAPPRSAGLPKKSGKMAGLFKGFGKARKQGTF